MKTQFKAMVTVGSVGKRDVVVEVRWDGTMVGKVAAQNAALQHKIVKGLTAPYVANCTFVAQQKVAVQPIKRIVYNVADAAMRQQEA